MISASGKSASAPAGLIGLLLIGSGGHARACIDVVEQGGRFTIAGLIGLPAEVGTSVVGYPVVGVDADLASLRLRNAHALIAVGQIKDPAPRIRLFELLQQQNWTLPSVVSPRSYVSAHARLGAGSVVMHGATVNAGAVVGRNCIVNSHALVEHDAVIGDHCHIATAAVVNGGVHVGSGTFVGSNATIHQQVNIGERCIIGMAQVVRRDCEAGTRLPPGR
jgi:sugar O-acyltransferase (sialic acid O-acetyltransferase NeuD family)